MALLAVLEETQHLTRELAAIIHRHAGIALREEHMRILEVEHVVADDDCLAMRRRLEDIVPAMRDQTAADIDHVADAVYLAQLADRIQQDDIMPRTRRLQKLGTPGHLEAGPAAERSDFARAQEVARGNDQLRLREFLPQNRECPEHQLILTLMRTAGEEDLPAARETHLLQQLLLFLLAHIRIGLIEFRVAGDNDQVRVRAQAHDILCVDWRLHRELGDGADHIVEQTVQMMVARYALVADASIDHHDRDMHFPGRPQEIRPQLGLHRQEHARAHPAQHMGCQPRQVQRIIDDAVRILDDAIGHFVAAVRDYGNQDRALREFTAEFLDQRARGHYLANGSCVYPDTIFLRDPVQRMRREKAKQALANPFYKASLPHRTDQEHWNDQKHNENGRYIIK